MALNLHLLRLFTAVVERGGVAAAGRALNLSQPAISRAIRELERQTGVRLLERSSRGVRLTSEGADVYAHARGVFAAERAVEEGIASLKGVQRGTLHLGASTTIATYVLPPLIAHFSRTHPGIELVLSAVHTRMLVQLMKTYDLDIALAEAPVADPRIRVSRWRLDHMVMICAADHPLAAAERVHAADLAERALPPPRAGIRNSDNRAAGARGGRDRAAEVDGCRQHRSHQATRRRRTRRRSRIALFGEGSARTGPAEGARCSRSRSDASIQSPVDARATAQHCSARISRDPVARSAQCLTHCRRT